MSLFSSAMALSTTCMEEGHGKDTSGPDSYLFFGAFGGQCVRSERMPETAASTEAEPGGLDSIS